MLARQMGQYTIYLYMTPKGDNCVDLSLSLSLSLSFPRFLQSPVTPISKGQYPFEYVCLQS